MIFSRNNVERITSAVNPNPIGVFDSGLGGLRVLHHLFKVMPYKDFLYFADLKHMPYGGRTSEEIVLLSQKNIQWLAQKGCELVVAACHTSTTCLEVEQCVVVSCPYFLNMAHSLYHTVHDAETAHSLKSVVILATERTVGSHVYQRALAQRLPHLDCRAIACPTWVPAIESGSEEKKRHAVSCVLSDICDVDAVVYGCTHFCEMDRLLEEHAPHVLRLDPARTLASTLRTHMTDPQKHYSGTVRIFTNATSAPLLEQYAREVFSVGVEYV